MELSDTIKCKRISIVGASGSGKSTLAVKLGKILNLPVHHIDCYKLKPNWQLEDKETVAKNILRVVEQEKWVMDGTYTQTMKTRFEHSDLIIFLNFPIEFCIENIIQRNKRNEKRIGLPDYLDNSNERIYELVAHLKEKFPQNLNNYILPLTKANSEKVIELHNFAEVDDFMEKIIHFL